jgi:rubrerythrin
MMKALRPKAPAGSRTPEKWRCRKCGYCYLEQEYLLPLGICENCGAKKTFEKVTADWEYHPFDDLMILP